MKTKMDMFFEDDEVVDFGSIRMTEVKQRNVRNYTLLSADKDKLNKNHKCWQWQYGLLYGHKRVAYVQRGRQSVARGVSYGYF